MLLLLLCQISRGCQLVKSRWGSLPMIYNYIMYWTCCTGSPSHIGSFLVTIFLSWPTQLLTMNGILWEREKREESQKCFQQLSVSLNSLSGQGIKSKLVNVYMFSLIWLNGLIFYVSIDSWMTWISLTVMLIDVDNKILSFTNDHNKFS